MSLGMRHALLAVIAILVCGHTSAIEVWTDEKETEVPAAAAPHEVSHIVSFTPQGLPGNNPFRGFEVFDTHGLVRFYSNDVSEKVLPTVIFIPGSGCDAAFALNDGKAWESVESLNLRPDLRLIRLEPPGVQRQQRSKYPGQATGCPDTFLGSASLDRNITYYSHAIEAVQRSFAHPGEALMVVGTSDGASIAPFLMAEHPEVSHLLLIAAGGGTQLFDELDLAFRKIAVCSTAPQAPCSHDENRLHAQSIIDAWRELLSDDPVTSLAWYRGHPPARWQSLGLAHTAEALLAKCCVKLYLAHGGHDTEVSSSNFSYLLARLVEHHRPFVAEFVACGDHRLMCPGEQTPERLAGVLDRAFEWFVHGSTDDAYAMAHTPAPKPQDVASP